MNVRAWPWNFVLLLSMYRVSGQECLENYADAEKALIDDPENSYQIAKAFFMPRSEGETLCATVFYYLGLNSTEEPSKSNCPSVTLGRNQEFHGCSKWKWCVNTFYMDLNITQLQLFSFFIIYEKTAEIELRIPPFCVGNETMYEYLLHATNSVSQLPYCHILRNTNYYRRHCNCLVPLVDCTHTKPAKTFSYHFMHKVCS